MGIYRFLMLGVNFVDIERLWGSIEIKFFVRKLYYGCLINKFIKSDRMN